MQFCGTSLRGWTKDEQVTTFGKISCPPPGLKKLTPEQYLDATRFQFEIESTRRIPWALTSPQTDSRRQSKKFVRHPTGGWTKDEQVTTCGNIFAPQG